MWFGGLLAVPLTLAEVGIAALQRHGKAAVGQVRYEFSAGNTTKSVKLADNVNEVNVICEDKNGKFMVTLDYRKAITRP